VVLVNDPLATIVDVGFAYDIRWMVLDGAGSDSSVTSILDGERPAWIGPPVYLEPGSFGIYPVCLNSSFDPRCFGTH
jgi:hypothetical protein